MSARNIFGPYCLHIFSLETQCPAKNGSEMKCIALRAGLPDDIHRYFQTKNPNLGKFLRVLQWTIYLHTHIFNCHLVYFVAFWYILWLFGILFAVLVCCTKKNLANLASREIRPNRLDLIVCTIWVDIWLNLCHEHGRLWPKPATRTETPMQLSVNLIWRQESMQGNIFYWPKPKTRRKNLRYCKTTMAVSFRAAEL
jgi:hypothetical protein